MYVITKDTKLNIKEIVREALGYYNEFPKRFESDYRILVGWLTEDSKDVKSATEWYDEQYHRMDSDFVLLLFDNYNGLGITPYIRKLFESYVESEFDGTFEFTDRLTLEDF